MTRSPYSTRFCTLFVLLLSALASASAASEDPEDLVVDLGRGPVVVTVPSSYDPNVPAPLLLLLHGFGSTGAKQEAYMRFGRLSDEFGFLYAHPDGTENVLRLQYWNGTDACCDFFRSGADDSGYLRDLIDTIKTLVSVDDDRVYLVGHSNGGFISYRMACDHSDAIAAIASLAGATWLDAGDCLPASPVHVLQIHGTADDTVRFDGGCFLPGKCYPGAIDTARQWVLFNECAPEVDTSSPPLNLDFSIPGDETRVAKVQNECAPGGTVELWVIPGGAHSPFLTPAFAREVVEYFYAHPKSR